MREIILDTETTGIDPASGHRVVEIGCVEMIGGSRTGAFFHTYLNPDRDMPEEAERVHGLSAKFLADKPRFSQVVEEFLRFIGNSKLVIHNAAFDMKFINSALTRTGFAPIEMSRATDTVMIARKKFPGSPASLDALCKRFNIDLSGRTKHGALLDAELLAEVYIELLGGRQVALFAENAGASASAQAQAVAQAQDREFIAARDFSPSADELAAHRAFLDSFKNPLWLVEAE